MTTEIQAHELMTYSMYNKSSRKKRNQTCTRNLKKNNLWAVSSTHEKIKLLASYKLQQVS
jgi:hypothetical protein